MVTRTCCCGKTFTAKKADIKRGWASCCSKSCAAFAREKKLDRNGYRDMNWNGRSNRERRDTEGVVFSHAHQFDNCEL